MNTPLQSKRSGAAGLLFGVGVLGSLGFAIRACFSPYLEPAASFIEWQARWGDGHYGVKATFLATWLNLLLLGGLLVAGAWAPYYLVTSLSSPRTPMPDGPQWSTLATKGLRNAALGLLFGLIPAAISYGILLTEPESLSFMGQGSVVVFMLAPILAGLGVVALFNLTLPRRVLVGAVEALRETTNDKGQVIDHVVAVGGQSWSLPVESWRQLKVGDVVAIQAPCLTTAPFALRVQRAAHYR
jgi:hypothetical protein